MGTNHRRSVEAVLFTPSQRTANRRMNLADHLPERARQNSLSLGSRLRLKAPMFGW